MAVKQISGSGSAPDGSTYVTLTDGAGNLGAVQAGSYPGGATPITASATGTTGATAATLAGAANVTTYLSGFLISSDATAAAAGAGTVTGTTSGTLNFRMGTGVTPAVVQTQVTFNPAIPASAVNTSIVVTSAAPGTGGNITVTAWGYRL